MELQSDLSPHQRIGRISPVEIALKTKRVQRAPSYNASLPENIATFLEELIVSLQSACVGSMKKGTQFMRAVSLSLQTFLGTSQNGQAIVHIHVRGVGGRCDARPFLEYCAAGACSNR